MGVAFPFSDIDSYFLTEKAHAGCIVDTSFLIAVSDKDHDFHDDAQFIFEKLVTYKIPLFVTVTNRTEFIDYHRRVIITEALMDMLVAGTKWKVSSSVREFLRSQKGWIDNQARVGNDPYLTDYRIKQCKQKFLPKTQSGQIGWVELCKEFLVGRLYAGWLKIEEELSLNYLDMRKETTQNLFERDLKWENMYQLSEITALGSSDSMIMNVLSSSVFKFIITSDYDLAYATMQASSDKVALAPDRIFNRHIKKLQF